MRRFSAAELLDAWEEGSAKTSAERAVELLGLISPETPSERLMGLSLGQRDSALLGLRERVFGSQMVAAVVCPDCGEQLDFTFDTRQIRAGRYAPDPLPDPELAQESKAEVTVSLEGYELRLRPANTGDAMAIADRTDRMQVEGVENDLDLARGMLLRRCLLSADHGGVAIPAEQIPSDVGEIAVQKMAEADPMADIQLAMKCPSCNRQWSAALDIVSFLWTEIEAWAWRLLNEVHTLASAYGWPERDILAMSATRRQCYLRMVWA